MLPYTLLEKARIKAGYTQEEAAEYAGISRNTLLAYEKGRTDIPATVFISLCKLYNCSIFDVFRVHTEHIFYDVPKSELIKAYVEFVIEEKRQTNERFGLKMSDKYYKQKSDEMYNEISEYAKRRL